MHAGSGEITVEIGVCGLILAFVSLYTYIHSESQYIFCNARFIFGISVHPWPVSSKWDSILSVLWCHWLTAVQWFLWPRTWDLGRREQEIEIRTETVKIAPWFRLKSITEKKRQPPGGLWEIQGGELMITISRKNSFYYLLFVMESLDFKRDE